MVKEFEYKRYFTDDFENKDWKDSLKEEIRIRQLGKLAGKTHLAGVLRITGKSLEDEIRPESLHVVVRDISNLVKSCGPGFLGLGLSEYANISGYNEALDRYTGVIAVIPLRRSILPSNIIGGDARTLVEAQTVKPILLNNLNHNWVQLDSGIIVESYVAEDTKLASKPYATRILNEMSDFAPYKQR